MSETESPPAVSGEGEHEDAAEVIPISSRIRPDFSANIGMALFLFSWGITFAGLAVAFLVVWWRAPQWPPEGTPPRPLALPITNTLIVLASSVAYDLAVRGARSARPASVRRWLLITALLGALFLVLQNVMWLRLWAAGLRLGENNYAGLFYALTWFHAAHVVAGLVVIGALTPRAMRGGFTTREHTPLRLSGWFWHFVTAAWLVVFALLWLL